MPQKSPCACRLERRPPLTQLLQWHLGLSTGSTLHAESLAMRSTALPFLRQVLSGGVTQGLAYFGLCGGLGPELPSALALQRPLGEALLARDPKPAATRVAAAAVECVGGPRQAQPIIAVAQARP